MLRLLAAALFMSAAAAEAQVVQGTQVVNLNLGGCLPLTREDGISKREGLMGVCGGAQYLHYFQPSLAAGVDLKYMAFGRNSYSYAADGGSIVEAEDTPSAGTYMAVLRDDLLPEKKWRPYGLLGIGLNSFSRRRVEITAGGRAETFRKSDPGAVFALAGGLDHDLTENVLAGFELRWNFLTTNKDKVGGFHFTALSMLGGLGWKFGKR